MTTYTLKGHITEDGRLEADSLPAGLPPGDVQIIVEPLSTQRSNLREVLAALAEIDARSTPAYRTKEEAEALIEELRNEWDAPR
jgi:hypothetical protein